MPPNPTAVAKPGGHEWTKFEIHTLLCLMSRNVHIRGLPVPGGEQQGTAMAAGGSSRKSKKKRAELPHVSKRSAHMDVATALNRALNGLNISQDIDHREVSTMIDKIVIEKKGSLAVVQRQKPKRMTRFLKHVLRRNIGFTGDGEEWDAGRKEEVGKLESEKAERGFTMAMAGVSDAVLGGGDGLGGNFYYQRDMAQFKLIVMIQGTTLIRLLLMILRLSIPGVTKRFLLPWRNRIPFYGVKPRLLLR
jgi:hypothetical protein